MLVLEDTIAVRKKSSPMTKGSNRLVRYSIPSLVPTPRTPTDQSSLPLMYHTPWDLGVCPKYQSEISSTKECLVNDRETRQWWLLARLDIVDNIYTLYNPSLISPSSWPLVKRSFFKGTKYRENGPVSLDRWSLSPGVSYERVHEIYNVVAFPACPGFFPGTNLLPVAAVKCRLHYVRVRCRAIRN